MQRLFFILFYFLANDGMAEQNLNTIRPTFPVSASTDIRSEPPAKSVQRLYSLPVGGDGWMRKIIDAPDDTMYVLWNVGEPNTLSQPFVSRHSASGELLWLLPISGVKGLAWGGNVDTEKNLVVVGTKTDDEDGQVSSYIAKYSPDGSLIFKKIIKQKDTSVNFFNVATSPNRNDILITGSADSLLHVPRKAIVMRFSKKGEIVWTKNFAQDFSTYGEDIRINKHGEIFVTGVSYGEKSGFLSKLDRNGNVMASQSLGFEETYIPFHLELTHAGKVVIAGRKMRDGDPSGWNGFIRKYSADLHLMWEQTISTSSLASIAGISIDSNNDILFCGTLWGDMSNILAFNHPVSNIDRLPPMTQDGWRSFFGKVSSDGQADSLKVVETSNNVMSYSALASSDGRYLLGFREELQDAGGPQYLGHILSVAP